MEVESISVNKLVPNPFQPRKEFNQEKMDDLALSIEKNGQLVPIIIRVKGSKYEIAEGERRWRCLKQLKSKEIQAVVKDLSDNQMREIAYISNAQREDLLPWERENAIYELWKTGMYKTFGDLDKKLGYKSKGQVKTAIDSREYRLKAELSENIDTFTIKSTKGLDDDIRKKVIAKVDAGEISKRDSYKYAGKLKKMPKPMQEAIVSDKIEIEDAQPLVDAGLSDDLLEPAIEELSDRKSERDTIQKLQSDTDVSIVKGKLKSKGIKINKSFDLQKLEKFEKIRDQIRWWGPSTVMQIENEDLRKKAIAYVRDIEEFCGNLIEQMAKEI